MDVETPHVAARLCCLDLDTFFVSVERLLDPSLAGKQVVVGGSRQRGVVTAASYEVRELGVHSGMAMARALQLAPHAVYLPTRHGVYSPYSAKVKAILEHYSPVVRPASIDEFFVDLRGCEQLYQQPQDEDADATVARVAWQMRDEIQAELGLPSSVGIGATRTIAKIASGFAKPAGVLMVPAGHEEEFVAPLPVRKVPGIGPVTEGRMLAAGIETVGQLLGLPPGPLRERFGGAADSVRRAIDPDRASASVPNRPAFLEHDTHRETVGSISNERTFSADVGDHDAVERQLLALCERVCWRARKRAIRARTVTVKLRYSDFETLTRSRTLGRPADDDRTVYGCARRLLRENWKRSVPIRLLGVALSNLVDDSTQPGLPFGEPEPRAIGSAVDAVRARFGFNAIRLGATGSTSWLEQSPADVDDPAAEDGEDSQQG